MPFVETILFSDDKKNLKEINYLISQKISKIFKIKGNTITIYNNFIDKKNFYHNFTIKNSEKRIFIKISGLKRNNKKKRELALLIINGLNELIKVKKPSNIAVYYYDKSINDIHHGS